MELSGRLSSFPIAELLHWAHNDRRTGSLVVRSSGREKRIYFREGKILTCLTDEPSEFYGQFLLLSAYLDQEQLLRCVSLCRERGKRLGQVLEEEGILSLEDIQRTLRYHIEDVICDIFLWNHGVFFFRADAPPHEDLLAEPIAPTGLAMEGSHWVDQVRRIRRVFVDDLVVLGHAGEPRGDSEPQADCEPQGDLTPRQRRVFVDDLVVLGHASKPRGDSEHQADREPQGDLTPRQRRILDEIDGVRRLEALWGAVHGSYYRFLSAAFELHEAGRVEIVGHNRHLHPPRPDLGLDDLLFEQAAREQALSRHHFGHLASFERFVPVWVTPPTAEEWARMPERARSFYGRFDGVRRLEQILSPNEDDWSRELEFLMLQIGKEAVALLPAPAAELEKRSAAANPSSAWQRHDYALPIHRPSDDPPPAYSNASRMK